MSAQSETLDEAIARALADLVSRTPSSDLACMRSHYWDEVLETEDLRAEQDGAA